MQKLINKLRISYRLKDTQKGFSLIEVMLVMGIMAVIAVFAVSNFSGLRPQKALTAAVNSVIADMRGAVERSRAQQDGNQWWLHFENPAGAGNDFYLVCGGLYSGPDADCASEGGTQFSRTQLSAEVSFVDPEEGSSKDIVLAKATGLPVGSADVSLKSSSSSLPHKKITMSSDGRIDYSTPSKPDVVTNSATDILLVSATLNGSFSPNGYDSTAQFRYWSQDPGSCNDDSGTPTPERAISSGSGSTAISEPVSGLSVNTIYYFCAIGSNFAGISFGLLVSFTTGVSTSPPAVATSTANGITSSGATFNGNLSSKGTAAAVNVSFAWGIDAANLNQETAAQPMALTGSFQQAVTGLNFETTYYFRAKAVGDGAALGDILSFTTSGNNYLAVAHFTDPFITIYNQTGDTFTKLSSPAAGNRPAGDSLSAAFSPDKNYLAVAHRVSPFIAIYERTGDIFTKLSGPAAGDLPTGADGGVTFSPDGLYLAVAHDISPFITIYKRSGDTFTKLPNPTILPNGNAKGLGFSPNGTYLAVAHLVSPFITIYKRSGDTFTKLAGPTLPSTGRGAVFSPDSIYMVVTHNSTPFITIYKRSGDTFTKLDNPAMLPTSTGYGASFSPDGGYLAVPYHVAPFLIIYKHSGDNFIKLPDPDVLPTGIGVASSFSPDGVYLSIAHGASPFVTIYKRTGDLFAKLANPSVLPTGTGFGVAFAPTVAATFISAPTVIASSVSNITETSATMNGSANPNNGSATGWFRYSATNPVVCDDTFGTRIPSVGGTPLGSGSSSIAYSRSVSGLTVSATYYFCAIASNSGGTSFGSLLSFRAASSPTVVTKAASFLTPPPSSTPRYPYANSCAENSLTHKIYCFGGAEGTPISYLTEIVEYDPAQDLLTTKNAALPSARGYLSCAENSLTHKIYCFGGFNGGAMNQIVEYDPAQPDVSFLAVVTKAAALPSARYAFSCVENPLVHKIYCFGGWTGVAINQIVEYDPAQPDVSSLAVVTKAAALPSARYALSCSVNSQNHKIYCFGGYNAGALRQIVEYDPAQPDVSSLAVVTKSVLLPSGRFYFSCVENSSTHKIYCLGNSNQIVEYDEFASGGGRVAVKSAVLPAPRGGLDCAEDSANHRIYCFWGNGTNQLIEYRPLTDTLVTSPVTLPLSLWYPACAENSLTHKIYCFGGYTNTAVNQTVEYDTTTAAVATKAALPSPRYGASCAENSLTHKIYCFGGLNSSTINQIIEYDTIGNSFAIKAATFPTGRVYLSCAENSSTHKIYCFGGYDTASTNEIVEYDPATDTIAVQSAVLPTARYAHYCVENSSTHKIYCFGGYRYSLPVPVITDQIVEYNPAADAIVIKAAFLPNHLYRMGCAKDSSNQNIYCFGGSSENVSFNQIIEYAN